MIPQIMLVVGLSLICAGVALFSVPVALITAGALTSGLALFMDGK